MDWCALPSMRRQSINEKAVNYEMKFTSVLSFRRVRPLWLEVILIVKQWYQASIRNRRHDFYHFCDGVALIDPVFH